MGESQGGSSDTTPTSDLLSMEWLRLSQEFHPHRVRWHSTNMEVVYKNQSSASLKIPSHDISSGQSRLLGLRSTLFQVSCRKFC
jgi:hypothetical protein